MVGICNTDKNKIEKSSKDINTLFLLNGDKLEDQSIYKQIIYNTGVQISSNNNPVTGPTALYFNGSSYITLTCYDIIYNLTSWTVEWYECRTSHGDGITVFHGNYTGTVGYGLLFGYMSSAIPRLYLSTATSSWNVASAVSMGTRTINNWFHYAVVKNGNNYIIFCNGTQTSTFSSSNQPCKPVDLHIGHYSTNTNGVFQGSLANFRISNIARYTSNFTPPSSYFI